MTLLALAGCGGSTGHRSGSASAPPTTIFGDVYVHDVSQWLKGCNPRWRSPSVDDVHPGTQVTIKDGKGTTLALAELLKPIKQGGSFTDGVCDYPFTASSVPDAGFYAVSVANRDPVNFTREQVQAQQVAISITGD